MFGLMSRHDTMEELWFYRKYSTGDVRRVLELRMRVLDIKANRMRNKIRDIKCRLGAPWTNLGPS